MEYAIIFSYNHHIFFFYIYTAKKRLEWLEWLEILSANVILSNYSTKKKVRKLKKG